MKEVAEIVTLWQDRWSRSERILLKSLGMAFFACLTVLAAHIRIPLPFTPVPMTLQTFVVPLAGGFLGAVWGCGSMLLYLVFGLIGLDVFAGAQGGTAIFLAPTAGYVIGFFPAAALVGWFTRRNPSPTILLAAIVLSQIIILFCGAIGLMWNAGLSFEMAVQKGVVPFLIGDVFKIAASYMILFTYYQLTSHREDGDS